jgi:hypothetical protein
MSKELRTVKIGLLLVMLTLIFGIVLGVVFGINEDAVKSYISEGVAAYPALHDEQSNSKIWRYAQRAHFHATGIAAFSFGLLLLIMHSSLGGRLKTAAATLVGLGGMYPLSWFTMFILAPSIGRSAAHDHVLTEMFTFIGVGGMLAGLAILCANLFLGLFSES